MKNNKGFTLIEIIICIAILAIVGVTGIVITLNDKKNNNLLDYMDIILNASNVYLETNKEVKEQLYNEKNAVYIPLRALVNEGLLDLSNTKVTEKEIDENYILKAFTSNSKEAGIGDCLDITTIASFYEINSPTYICTNFGNEEDSDIALMSNLWGGGFKKLLENMYINYLFDNKGSCQNSSSSVYSCSLFIGEIDYSAYSYFDSINFVNYIDTESCKIDATTNSPLGYQCLEISDPTSKNKVYVWLVDKDNNGRNELYIGSDGKEIYANPDSSNLFKGITVEKEANFQKLNTSKVINMESFFEDSSFPENTNLSFLNTSNVTNMKSMFKGTSFKKLDFSEYPNFKTDSVENMSHMFHNSNLEALNISTLNTSNVEDMSYMFASTKLVELDFKEYPNFKTDKVKNMSYMFSYMNNLTKIDVWTFDTKTVEDMSYMFYYSNNLKYLDLTNFFTPNVSTFERMFAGTEKLETLSIACFTIKETTNVWYMFYDSRLGTWGQSKLFYLPDKLSTAYLYKHYYDSDGIIRHYKSRLVPHNCDCTYSMQETYCPSKS